MSADGRGVRASDRGPRRQERDAARLPKGTSDQDREEQEHAHLEG